MDWEKINLLLDIIHKVRDVPNTDYIWGCAVKELRQLNEPSSMQPSPEPVNVNASGEPELNFGARRL